jgi:phosphoribosylformylglycinamidine synthase PurS subunit
MFKAIATITLRPSILDPKGKASEQALHQLGMDSIHHVRMGKRIEMEVDAATEQDARTLAETACRKLLANEVMEDFSIEIQSR